MVAEKKSLLHLGTEPDQWPIILLTLPSQLIWTYFIRRINNYCFFLKHIRPRIICSKSSSIPSGYGLLDFESVQILRGVPTFTRTHTDFVSFMYSWKTTWGHEREDYSLNWPPLRTSNLASKISDKVHAACLIKHGLDLNSPTEIWETKEEIQHASWKLGWRMSFTSVIFISFIIRVMKI